MISNHIYEALKKRSHRSGSMTGFALWDVLLLVTLIASILLVIFLVQQSRVQLRTVEERYANLIWADDKIAGFAASQRRLPCPDTDNDGIENCEAGAVTGMLPLLSLGLKADAAARGPQQIKYSVLRPATMDLSVLESYFEPKDWEGTEYTYGTANGLDFCRKLEQVIDSDEDPVNGYSAANTTAYTVAVKQSDGNPDLVRSRSVDTLANAMSCIVDMSSVNGVALAVDVANEVTDENQSIHDSAIITIAFNVLHIVLAGVDVALAAINLAASITMLGTASGLLSGAIASCIVLVGCAFIPVYTAAVVASVIAITLSGVAIAAGALGIAALVYSTVLAVEVAIATGNATGDQTLDVDLDAQLQTVLDLEAKANQAEADSAAEAIKLQNALAARDAALNTINTTNTNDPNGQHTALVNTAVTASVAYNNARMAQNQAQGDYDKAGKDVTDLTTALNTATTNCASADLPKEQYKCDAVPKVQQRLTTAQQVQATALTTLNAANAQVTSTRTAYETARNAVIAATNSFGSYPLPPPFDFFTTNLFDDYLAKYYLWQKTVLSNATLAQTAIDTRANATSARAAYEQLKYNAEHPGSTPTGSQIMVWAGAEAILEQADANGDVE